MCLHREQTASSHTARTGWTQAVNSECAAGAQIAPPTPAAESPFPVEEVREQFPALRKAGTFIFFDNAAGAQIPQKALDGVTEHLLDRQVQRGARYMKSLAVDASIGRARASLAALLNAQRPEEIAFGMNATSMIRLMSLAVAETLGERDEIVLTDLDHEANIAPWLAIRSFGAKILWWKAHEDGWLHAEDLKPLVSGRTRLVACTLASNALGSIVDVRPVAEVAHGAGADLFVDATHYAAHGSIDVQALDCDYLVASAYKMFAPHVAYLWGRYEKLLLLPTFREEDIIPDQPPGKIEAGTFIYENVAGLDGTIGYLAQLGHQIGGNPGVPHLASRKEDIRRAMLAIAAYERGLTRALLRVLRECGAQVYGITDESRLTQRLPTISFNIPGMLPRSVSKAAARAEIGIRDGHHFVPRFLRRLGLDVTTGMVRVSLVHYNTIAEIERFGEVLQHMIAARG